MAGVDDDGHCCYPKGQGSQQSHYGLLLSTSCTGSDGLSKQRQSLLGDMCVACVTDIDTNHNRHERGTLRRLTQQEVYDERTPEDDAVCAQHSSGSNQIMCPFTNVQQATRYRSYNPCTLRRGCCAAHISGHWPPTRWLLDARCAG